MSWWDALWPVVAALIPSAGLGYLFYVVMKHVLEADRRERAALREWEQQVARETEKGPRKDPQSPG
ncbi:hypothetical protein [Ornithinicoccus halotolerans]|uniref:hypothetical protein n=1 Tax=Ornithinicoccus halotolerans TaxID=1748220 RepID=UPI0012968D18|nr:hypothetical protein [Ornithinicoccus halotolerans]